MDLIWLVAIIAFLFGISVGASIEYYRVTRIWRVKVGTQFFPPNS